MKKSKINKHINIAIILLVIAILFNLYIYTFVITTLFKLICCIVIVLLVIYSFYIMGKGYK